MKASKNISVSITKSQFNDIMAVYNDHNVVNDTYKEYSALIPEYSDIFSDREMKFFKKNNVKLPTKQHLLGDRTWEQGGSAEIMILSNILQNMMKYILQEYHKTLILPEYLCKTLEINCIVYATEGGEETFLQAFYTLEEAVKFVRKFPTNLVIELKSFKSKDLKDYFLNDIKYYPNDNIRVI